MRILVCLVLAGTSTARAQLPPALLATTIVARQTSGWFMADGEMKADAPGSGFEQTFQVTDSSLIRRSVKNLTSGQVLVDETEYFFIQDLVFADQARVSLTFQRLTPEKRRLIPAVRAIGRPGTDAIEMLQIGPDWIQSVKTVADYMVIQRSARSQ